MHLREETSMVRDEVLKAGSEEVVELLLTWGAADQPDLAEIWSLVEDLRRTSEEYRDLMEFIRLVTEWSPGSVRDEWAEWAVKLGQAAVAERPQLISDLSGKAAQDTSRIEEDLREEITRIFRLFWPLLSREVMHEFLEILAPFPATGSIAQTKSRLWHLGRVREKRDKEKKEVLSRICRGKKSGVLTGDEATALEKSLEGDLDDASFALVPRLLRLQESAARTRRKEELRQGAEALSDLITQVRGGLGEGSGSWERLVGTVVERADLFWKRVRDTPSQVDLDSQATTSFGAWSALLADLLQRQHAHTIDEGVVSLSLVVTQVLERVRQIRPALAGVQEDAVDPLAGRLTQLEEDLEEQKASGDHASPQALAYCLRNIGELSADLDAKLAARAVEDQRLVEKVFTLLPKAAMVMELPEILAVRERLECAGGRLGSSERVFPLLADLRDALRADLENLQRREVEASESSKKQVAGLRSRLRDQLAEIRAVAGRWEGRRLQHLEKRIEAAQQGELENVREELDRVLARLESRERLRAARVRFRASSWLARKYPDGSNRPNEAKEIAGTSLLLEQATKKRDILEMREQRKVLRRLLSHVSRRDDPRFAWVLGMGAVLAVMFSFAFLLWWINGPSYCRFSFEPPPEREFVLELLQDGVPAYELTLKPGEKEADLRLDRGAYAVYIDRSFTGVTFVVPEKREIEVPIFKSAENPSDTVPPPRAK